MHSCFQHLVPHVDTISSLSLPKRPLMGKHSLYLIYTYLISVISSIAKIQMWKRQLPIISFSKRNSTGSRSRFFQHLRKDYLSSSPQEFWKSDQGPHDSGGTECRFSFWSLRDNHFCSLKAPNRLGFVADFVTEVGNTIYGYFLQDLGAFVTLTELAQHETTKQNDKCAPVASLRTYF